jgi:hypothetical protein
MDRLRFSRPASDGSSPHQKAQKGIGFLLLLKKWNPY